MIFTQAAPIAYSVWKPNPVFPQMRNGSWELRPIRDIQQIAMEEKHRKKALLDILPYNGTIRFYFVFNLPGYKPEEIKMTITDEILHVEGSNFQRAANDGNIDKQNTVYERKLSEYWDISTIKATLHEDGLLVIFGLLKPKEGKKIPKTAMIPKKIASYQSPKPKM